MFSRILAHGIFFYFHLKRYWQGEMLKYLTAQRRHDVSNVLIICKYSEYDSNTHTQTSLPFLAAKAMALAWKRSTK